MDALFAAHETVKHSAGEYVRYEADSATLVICDSCDTNCDGAVNGLDIQTFLSVLLGQDTDARHIAASDLDTVDLAFEAKSTAAETPGQRPIWCRAGSAA